jgi:hypothetical protein
MINTQEILEWLSAFAVVISGALAGHYAYEGMNALQWAGAATAVLGSVTLAVACRTWPAKAKARDSRFKD